MPTAWDGATWEVAMRAKRLIAGKARSYKTLL
jgi:hypothetical protein